MSLPLSSIVFCAELFSTSTATASRAFNLSVVSKALTCAAKQASSSDGCACAATPQLSPRYDYSQGNFLTGNKPDDDRLYSPRLEILDIKVSEI
jgi:hypothetical protein